ncbi:IS3 family transposase, partial [Amylibacter sp.]|nr:IS3 family transposase [Amylibacter sp.]
MNLEFKVKSAQLVLDQRYSIRETADAMSVRYSILEKWVRTGQLNERA